MVKVESGQQVIVMDGHGRAKAQVYRGTVAKIGRIWIDVHREGSDWGWRFRLDTQTDGSKFGVSARFYTLEQWAEKQCRDSAMAWLHGQGITVGYTSPWRGEEVKLARTLGWVSTD